jgi:hypothetical protein
MTFHADDNTDFVVPDLIEPVVSWRLWTIGLTAGGLRLYSVTQATFAWQPRIEARATCNSAGMELSGDPPHEVSPLKEHDCGFYSMKTLGGLVRTVLPQEMGYWCRRPTDPTRTHDPYPERIAAVGLVKGWGKAIEGEFGWRTAVAYPSELWVLHDQAPYELAMERADIAPSLVDLYSIPVHDAGTLDDVPDTIAS